MSNSSIVGSKSVHHVAYTTRDPQATYDCYTQKMRMRLVRTENHRQGDSFFRDFILGMRSGEAIAFFYLFKAIFGTG